LRLPAKTDIFDAMRLGITVLKLPSGSLRLAGLLLRLAR
jgi:hypothetical protein